MWRKPGDGTKHAHGEQIALFLSFVVRSGTESGWESAGDMRWKSEDGAQHAHRERRALFLSFVFRSGTKSCYFPLQSCFNTEIVAINSLLILVAVMF